MVIFLKNKINVDIFESLIKKLKFLKNMIIHYFFMKFY